MVSARFTALAFAAAASAQIVPAPVTCPTNGAPYLMVGPGCMIPCFSHGYGNLATLVNNITTYYPGTSTYTVPYTNNTLQGQVSTPVFVAQANAIYQQCPESPIVMVGHSLGGIIVMNTLCGGNFPYTTNVVAAVTYGEETYVGGQPYDTGSCTSNAPNFTRQSTAGCQKWTPILQDYCMADDAKCCATGTSVAVHQEYAQYYDLQAFAFIKAQLAKFVAPVISSSSSSSVVSSTSTSTSTSSSSTFSPTDASITSSTTSSTEFASSADSTSTLTTTIATTSYSTISISTATAPGFTNSSVPAGSASSTSAAASGSESGSVAPVSSTTGPAPVVPATPVPTTVTTVVPISFTSVVSGSTIVISASLTTDVPGVVVSSSFQPTYAYPTVPLSAVAESLSGSAQSSYLAAVSSASASLASAASAASATPAEATTTTSVVKLAPSAEGAPSKSGAAGAGVGPASSTQKAGSKPSGTSAGTLPAYTGAASQLSMPVSLCIAIAALMFFQA